eukprot:3010549-Rhodomonas_salina.1
MSMMYNDLLKILPGPLLFVQELYLKRRSRITVGRSSFKRFTSPTAWLCPLVVSEAELQWTWRLSLRNSE